MGAPVDEKNVRYAGTHAARRLCTTSKTQVNLESPTPFRPRLPTVLTAVDLCAYQYKVAHAEPCFNVKAPLHSTSADQGYALNLAWRSTYGATTSHGAR